MGLLDTVKEIAGYAQQVDNIALNKAILELQKEAFANFDQIREMKERIRELEQQLAKKSEMKFTGQFYFVDGDSTPFCPVCWDSKQHAIHLIPTGDPNEWECHVCKFNHVNYVRVF